MVTMRFKLVFFDSRPIKRGMDRVARSALSHWGAIVRKHARWSMKKKEGPAAPGAPPHRHGGAKGGKLRDLLFYSYDPIGESVVVGPVKFGRGEAPSLLERGGTTRASRPLVFHAAAAGQGQRRGTGGRFQKAARGRLVRVAKGTRLAYRPRPFMGPARDEGDRRLKECWIKARSKFRS